MTLPIWANVAYLVSSALFIFGLKGLTHPRTAVRGNQMSALAMLIAVITTLSLGGLNYGVILAGVVVGAVIGAYWATTVKMTEIPELVALFNGLGGGASTFVAWAELSSTTPTEGPALVAASLAGIIGTVTLTGSLVAYGKLAGKPQVASEKALKQQPLVNGVLTLSAILLALLVYTAPAAAPWVFLLLVLASGAAGIGLVLPIGGADMPVVIALLNSLSGLAAAATGFVLGNNVLIIAGSLVGSSGFILTMIMCRAMNRSLGNVLFGKIEVGNASSDDEVYAGKINKTDADEVAMMLDGVQRVVFVPGYGMAVAQAQHAVRSVYNLLEERGVTVEFAIHPVAGRMPGHMNVLLAEVDIPYERLIEAERINPTMDTVDMAIVLGANDVVNPDARRPDSPIAGMPIVDVDKAHMIVVVKRSLRPGYAKIPNPLFAHERAVMLFADGKQAMMDLANAIEDS